LRSDHPDLGINIKYIELPVYNNTRYQILNPITNGTTVDIVTLDQIWLGEFAQKGLLTDLANYTKKKGVYPLLSLTILIKFIPGN